MDHTSHTAMQDVLADLTPAQTRTLLSYMQACEPDSFEAAVVFVTRQAVPA